jgi:hypothetical protein
VRQSSSSSSSCDLKGHKATAMGMPTLSQAKARPVSCAKQLAAPSYSAGVTAVIHRE